MATIPVAVVPVAQTRLTLTGNGTPAATVTVAVSFALVATRTAPEVATLSTRHIGQIGSVIRCDVLQARGQAFETLREIAEQIGHGKTPVMMDRRARYGLCTPTACCAIDPAD